MLIRHKHHSYFTETPFSRHWRARRLHNDVEAAPRTPPPLIRTGQHGEVLSLLAMRPGSLYDVLSFLPLILAQTATSSKICRCLYGQSCWPSEQDFVSLSSNLSRPLIHPVPPASACYPIENPSGNCSDVQLNWRDGNWRADQPGAYQNINFETYTNKNGSISACYSNTTLNLPCEQGSVPPIGVDAGTVGDVQAAVRFAAQHNLRLAVKNTGYVII